MMADDKTLRDEFALGALTGDWASSLGRFDDDGDPEHLRSRANLYYRMADAMLQERQGNLRHFRRPDDKEPI
jgi:hypothetical protein